MRISFLRLEGVVEPKLEGPPVGRGSEMCGFIVGVVLREREKSKPSQGSELEDGDRVNRRESLQNVDCERAVSP